MARKNSAVAVVAAAATAQLVATVSLAEIVAAGETGMWVPEAEAADLAAKGFLELAPKADTDPPGKVYARATNSGKSFVAAQEPIVVKAASVEESESEFVIESDIAIPLIHRRGGPTGSSKYPFDKLLPNQSFFIPRESEKLASTVAAANARYAVPTGNTRVNRKGKTVPETKQERQFIIRSEVRNGVKGSRIFRKF